MIHQHINIRYSSGFKVILHTFRLFIIFITIIVLTKTLIEKPTQQNIILPITKKTVNMLRLTEAANTI